MLELAADGAPVEEIAARAHLLAPAPCATTSPAPIAKLGAANRHEACADRPADGLDLNRLALARLEQGRAQAGRASQAA